MIERYSDHAANERTFLAWVRTAIAIMAFGFLVQKFDLFLRIAAGSLNARSPSADSQIVGNIAGLRTSLLVWGKIALEILSGPDLLCGCRKIDVVITMARYRTLSSGTNAMISAAQCRSARALLGWSVAKLASAASVSASVIDDFEAERPCLLSPGRSGALSSRSASYFCPAKTSACAPGRCSKFGGGSARVHVRQTRRSLAA
jgi:hypothetical protein